MSVHQGLTTGSDETKFLIFHSEKRYYDVKIVKFSPNSTSYFRQFEGNNQNSTSIAPIDAPLYTTLPRIKINHTEFVA